MSETPHPKLDDTHTGHPTLKCPRCGGLYLHQNGVEVFSRHKEDSSRGIHAAIDYYEERANVDTRMDGNPSGRRDGIRISFECEFCPSDGVEGDHVLSIVQHKGNERIEWVHVAGPGGGQE